MEKKILLAMILKTTVKYTIQIPNKTFVFVNCYAYLIFHLDLSQKNTTSQGSNKDDTINWNTVVVLKNLLGLLCLRLEWLRVWHLFVSDQADFQTKLTILFFLIWSKICLQLFNKKIYCLKKTRFFYLPY